MKFNCDHYYYFLFLVRYITDQCITCPYLGRQCSKATNGSTPLEDCDDETSLFVMPLLLGLYILITNVLVLNLIIAMFRFVYTYLNSSQ